MRKELLDKITAFEIFMERLDTLIDTIREDEEVKNGTRSIDEFDLRFQDQMGDSIVFNIPQTILDFLEIWHWVLSMHKLYLAGKTDDKMPDEIFLDVYWNNVEANSAFYEEEKTIWMYFQDDGVHYDNEEEFNPALYDNANCGTVIDGVETETN